MENAERRMKNEENKAGDSEFVQSFVAFFFLNSSFCVLRSPFGFSSWPFETIPLGRGVAPLGAALRALRLRAHSPDWPGLLVGLAVSLVAVEHFADVVLCLIEVDRREEVVVANSRGQSVP